MKKHLKWYILGIAILGVWTCSRFSSGITRFWIFPYDTQAEIQESNRTCLIDVWEPRHLGKNQCYITLKVDGHEASYQQAFEEKQFNAKAEWVDEKTVSVDFIYRDSGETFQTITLRHHPDSPDLEFVAEP
ncbi:hypothetical protein [Rubritalea marina]|uniref:hypothetical protein n=1 Tax=Rubritalea marina TaxID=361055 RepID=UPI0003803C4D|nr:hypothetical protein [Rubritalea marina]